MKIEYWKLKSNPNVMMVASIYENGLIQVGKNTWTDYGSFNVEMERYGYQKIGD